MGSLAVPGPKMGSKGAPQAPKERKIPPFWEWFPSFLRDELRPYPGRSVLALRYVLAATLTMLVIVTFRIPGASVGGFYSLLLPRDAPSTTAKSALAILSAFTVSLAFSVLGTMLFIDYPITHFLWVIGSFFLGFLALAVMSNYAAASAFAILIVLAVPAWDAPIPTAGIVAANLWVAGSVVVAISATLVVETVFALFETTDQLESALSDRLAAVRTYLESAAKGQADPKAHNHVQQLAMVGVSRLRKLANSSKADRGEIARRSTAVSLVGRLVDLVAALHPDRGWAAPEKPRLANLVWQLGEVQRRLRGSRDRPAKATERSLRDEQPLLLDLERTTELLQLSFSRNPGHAWQADTAQASTPPFFLDDAWSNPEHLQFALRGCLAAVICYFIMNAVAWPGLSTSLFTCVVTALTSVGSSRQKQLLRVCGAIVGGVIFGIGSQVLILPMLDTITGFTVMFVTVTCIAAWFITASPRLSYFGTQMALAFYLIHLAGPFAQTNIAIARNNVVGILLGLVVMWLVFDKLGAKPAAVVMRQLFASNLKLMAQLATPWADEKKADLGHIRTLREKISQNFSAVNSQADAVLFETGRERANSLAVRNKLLGWQPRVRSLFLLQVALLQYRAPISPAELPAPILKAQVGFDAQIETMMKQMAQSFDGRPRATCASAVRQAYQQLQDEVSRSYGSKPTPRAEAVLSLSSHLVEGAISLAEELKQHGTA